MQQQTCAPKVAFPWHSIPRPGCLNFYETEDFEGTEELLRKEIKEGWQEPKGEVE